MTDLEQEENDYLPGPENPCPNCGQYYVLTITAPPMPALLAENGTDEELNQWDAIHNYNISQCSSCGWRSDED